MSDSEPSRFVSRSVPSDELLPTIIEEANLDDDGIFGIEHLLLTSAELEPEVLLSLCLVLGRCAVGIEARARFARWKENTKIAERK